MAFLLDSKNVFAYLIGAGLWDKDQTCDSLSSQSGKNFSLRITGGDRDLLVKQETHDPKGVAVGEVLRESWFYELLEVLSEGANAADCLESANESELVGLRSRIVYPLHFDAESSILVFPYLDNVRDLSDFYRDFCRSLTAADSVSGKSDRSVNEKTVNEKASGERKELPVAIAAALGESFAQLHRSTFQRSACKRFLEEKYLLKYSKSGRSPEQARARAVPTPNFLAGLKRITPEMFCVIPTDALKFFRFYQRYPAIGEAIEFINQSFDRACVVHNDPRFANFLLHDFQKFELSQPQATVDSANSTADRAVDSTVDPTVQPTEKPTVQLIDWEKWAWGDPAYDLGQIIANYLQLWLKSLPVSANLDLATTLSRARVPLAAVQPSIAALMRAYLVRFPEILSYRPDFLVQSTRFAGLGLIRQVQIYIYQKHPLGNVEMVMVQVAKSLLCQPEASIPTVFGQSKAAMESVLKPTLEPPAESFIAQETAQAVSQL